MAASVRFPAFALAPLAVANLLLCHPTRAVAEEADAPPELPTVQVVAPTPLPGLDVPRDQMPSNVQTATDADLERLHSPDLTNYLRRAVGGVTVNETQGNPF